MRRRSSRADAGLHGGERAARRDREDFTDDDAYHRDHQTLQHNITKNRSASGAQRHPNADFLGPKTYAIRDNAVEADRCKYQREQAETREDQVTS